jgi:dipeptidyl aminopeptidase/acylaminoacyl peptidase
MKYFIVFVLCCFCFAPLAAQKRAFELADLYQLRSVEDPQYSPDGTLIAFVSTSYDLAHGTSDKDIYVVHPDGSGLRRLTDDPALDSHPRWSPDGSSILFISNRENGNQAWLLSVRDGTTRQLTNLTIGVCNPEWTPDGKRIIFTSDVYPEYGANDSLNAAIDSSTEAGPLQAHMADRLLYRHWTSWKDGKRTHILAFDIARSDLTDLTPGDFDSPSFSIGEKSFDVSPDGKEICFTSQRDGKEAQTTNKDLWTASTDGSAAVSITKDNLAFDGNPAYSPDGRYIAYRFQKVPGYESDLFRIGLYDRATRTKRVMTPTFNNWVDNLGWSPDAKTLYFTADVNGHTPLYALDIGTGKIREVIDLKTIDAFVVSPDGSTLALDRRSVGEPREIWTAPTKGGRAQQVTFFNKEVTDHVDIRPAEELWIPSPTGAKIQTFLVTPHGFDPRKRYPLILNVHGGPQSQWTDGFRGDWQVYPGAGYIVAFPNPHGSTGRGQDFTLEISKDWGGKVYEDVMAVADSLARLPYVDPDRMGAMGWSFGGYMMMWLEGHTRRFKALAAMMGVYDLTAEHGATEELWFPEFDLGGTPWTSDLYERWSPDQYVKNFSTPCLVITGEKDYRVPYTQSLEFFNDLQEMNVASRLIVFKNDGHWPNVVKSMPFYYNAHLDWFHRYLGGGTPPYNMTEMLRNRAYGGSEGLPSTRTLR